MSLYDPKDSGLFIFITLYIGTEYETYGLSGDEYRDTYTAQ